jgi:hypothetical protein
MFACAFAFAKGCAMKELSWDLLLYMNVSTWLKVLIKFNILGIGKAFYWVAAKLLILVIA